MNHVLKIVRCDELKERDLFIMCSTFYKVVEIKDGVIFFRSVGDNGNYKLEMSAKSKRRIEKVV